MVCSKEFSQQEDLKKHLENICHSKCETCEKVFETLDTMKTHSICHANLVAKEDELVKCKDLMNKEIIEGEKRLTKLLG